MCIAYLFFASLSPYHFIHGEDSLVFTAVVSDCVSLATDHPVVTELER